MSMNCLRDINITLELVGVDVVEDSYSCVKAFSERRGVTTVGS